MCGVVGDIGVFCWKAAPWGFFCRVGRNVAGEFWGIAKRPAGVGRFRAFCRVGGQDKKTGFFFQVWDIFRWCSSSGCVGFFFLRGGIMIFVSKAAGEGTDVLPLFLCFEVIFGGRAF